MSYDTTLPGLHCIPLPTPFPVGDVNAYLAEGERLTLIDTGVNSEESYLALVDGLAACGYQISDIQRILITHHHTDHLGMTQRVVAESGAEVWCHQDTARWLEDYSGTRDYFQNYRAAFFRESGVPQPVLKTLATVDRYFEKLTGRGVIHPVGTLHEGSTFELVGCQWRVYHTPGHAGDLICLYQPDSKVLLSSDHLLRDVSSNPLIEAPSTPDLPRPRRLLDYIREMERIAQLDIVVAYTGHGEPISDARKLVDQRLAFHQKRATRILNLMDGQPSQPYELAQTLFPTVHENQTFLTISEIVGHLDMLERDGKLHVEQRGDQLFWVPTQ